MPWISREWNCGNIIIVEKYFASRYGAKKEVVTVKGKTSSVQQTINDRRAMFRYSILANANFREGDYFITYTFGRGKLPESASECKRVFNQYKRRLRAVYKKKGVDLKYICAFEHRDCRPHFHLLFNNEVNPAELPKWEYGTAHIELLDGRKYHTIGEYFVKVAYEDTVPKGKKMKFKGDLSSSRNLYRPEPKTKVLSSPNWSEQPQVKKGYELDYDSLDNGFTQVAETQLIFRYQSYRLIKLLN